MKWKLFDGIVVHIVNENFRGIGDTDNVIGCVMNDQRHVAEHIVNDHNAALAEVRDQERKRVAEVAAERDEARQGYHLLDRNWDAVHNAFSSAIRGALEMPDATVPELVARIKELKQSREPEIDGSLVADAVAAERRRVADVLSSIVISEGCDAGVILLSDESPTDWNEEHKCYVYRHENFSPLGDALVELAKSVSPTKGE